MSSKTIRSILVFMLIVIAALFTTQAYWFKQAFSLQERQFEEKLNITLRSIADDLLTLDSNSKSQIPPVTKISSTEFYVKTDCYYSLSTLDSCIRRHFISQKIDVTYDYLIIKSNNNQIILGNTVPDISNSFDIACESRLDDKDNVDFKIRINNKTAHLLSSMGIWMYSSFSLLAILAVFTFIMVSIVKGKKLALLKKDFVNNMTHELKTPIANISVASDAIRNRKIQMDETKLQRYADIIYKENLRLHNLVNRVLEISSIEKKEESLSFEEIDLHHIINHITDSFEPLIQKRDGAINLDLQAHNFKLNADRVHISNVINNLTDNAIKYSDNAPQVTITTKSDNNGIYVAISDEGIGLNSENQTRIFEKFFRAESENIHNTKGYGLGLSYAKLIVEKHGGSITFKSKEKIGSTFNIFLPFE
ncbi:MAG: hypothetical protein COA58_10630 [Bacteroidetes bacterium]|nr:MAG: hypothetical protein COA58_10630 [Bacteroidota bacterium]